MPIKVACRCGAAFAAPDHYAGKTVKCPKCAQPLTVPAPVAAPQLPPLDSGLSSLLDEAGINQSGPSCPQCQAPIAPNAALCTKCGFNLATGARVASAVKQKAVGHGDAADAIMERAAAELAKGPQVETETTTVGHLAGYLMTFGLIITAIVAIGFAYWGFTKIEASGNSQYYAGLVMAIVGTIMQLTAHIVLVVINFKAGTLHGVLSLVIPIWAPIYGALCNHGFWAFLWFLGWFFSFVGGFMLAWFAGGGGDEAVWIGPSLHQYALAGWHSLATRGC
ncbi:MAG: zinc ribbon domain-containing protein [Pirellulales bacterium]